MREIWMSPYVLASLAGLALACVALLLFDLLGGRSARLRNRLREAQGRGGPAAGASQPRRRREGLLGLLGGNPLPAGLLERLLPDDQAERTLLRSRLIQAGFYSASAVPTFVAVKLLLMVAFPMLGAAAGLAGLVPLGKGLLAGALGGFVGLLLPGLWLELRRTKRQRILRRSLPDFLDLSVSCLESGMSMLAAVSCVSEELHCAHPEFAGEMAIVEGELELGKPIEQAFLHLADRAGLEEMRWLATFVQQSQRFGTTMADALRELSDLLRTQREQRAEELAHKAAVKILLPTLLCIFPAIFVVLAGPAAVKIMEIFPKTKNAQEAKR